MTPADFLAVFLMGLFGTGHCIGMCGAFAIAAGAGAKGPGRILARQCAYQAGKALTYVFLAVVLVVAGGWVSANGMLPGIQDALGAVVGLGMIVLGAAYVGEWRWSARVARFAEGSRVCGALGAVLQAPTWWRSLLIGWLNGFLPCGLSLAAVTYAASFGSVRDAAVGAALFGLATLPGLFVVAWLGQGALAGARRGLLRLAGVMLIAMGLLTIVRGVPEVHEWFHRHTVWPG